MIQLFTEAFNKSVNKGGTGQEIIESIRIQIDCCRQLRLRDLVDDYCDLFLELAERSHKIKVFRVQQEINGNNPQNIYRIVRNKDLYLVKRRDGKTLDEVMTGAESINFPTIPEAGIFVQKLLEDQERVV